MGKKEAEDLLDALQGLPAPARTVLLLHYFQGCSVKEIGEILDMPISTIRARLFRAKKELEKALPNA